MSAVVPSEYPAPFDPSAYVARPGGVAPDQTIDVGVAIVGAGAAGLACAIRLAQRLEHDDALRERLGEVPIAVLEKGRQPGGHQVSGAVVVPDALRELLPDVDETAWPSSGTVRAESVYFMTRRRALRIPTPPTFHNKGNVVFSLSRLVRFLAERAEDLGVVVLPETDAQTLLVRDGTVHGVRTGAKGLDRDGRARAGSAPPNEVVAQATVLAEGTQGHLRGVAIDHFGLAPAYPQIYALGVKEVWRVARPLDRVIHTLGWPLRFSGRFGEVGGSFVYPMGEDQVCVGFVVGLEYADWNLSPHDLLQEFKTHPLIRRLLEGGERIAWGAKTIPEGGLGSIPARLAVPGAVICGDSAGLVNVPRLKGVHLAIRSGIIAADAIGDTLAAGVDPRAAGSLDRYDAALRRSSVFADLARVRNMRQALSAGLIPGGRAATLMQATRGAYPRGLLGHHADAEVPMRDLGRTHVDADGMLTFDKLSSVFLSGNRTRDDQPNHIRIVERVPEGLARTWVNMCPAAVYEIDETARTLAGEVTVAVAPSNCVQCGAITAKGGQLTPPEGGSGPEYTLT